MTAWKTDGPRAPRRGRGDDGASLVEFALIAVLLLTLVFGIINFGLILSFDQDVTRAAAESARAGAVAPPGDEAAIEAIAYGAAEEAVLEISDRFASDPCGGSQGMTCTVQVLPCDEQSFQCVYVDIEFDYENNRIYGDLPIVSALLPDRLVASSVARINQ